MSYILDALTKAAQQRDRQVPAVQRLLMRAPLSRSTWTRARGLVAALAVNAVLLTALLVWWLLSDSTSVPTAGTVAPEIARPEIERPATGRSETARSEAGRTLELDPPKARRDPPKVDLRAEKATSPKREPVAGPPPETPRPSPAPAVSAPSPRSFVAPTQPPPTVTAPAAPPLRGGLKLEALIYSDVPAQRMIFVNGRRYVEGDTIDGRLRVEEIQEDGVQLSEQGRRFTLRVDR